MLQQLQPIEFGEIQEDKNYVMHVTENERFGFSESYLCSGTGKDIIEKLKVVFGCDEDEDDYVWHEDATDKNGDGWDEVSVYEVEFLPVKS